ncbi:MAG: hypothetical protein IRZ08_14440 [Frankia sp.]|nr:hypothetical protein [Frankia sp.]
MSDVVSDALVVVVAVVLLALALGGLSLLRRPPVTAARSVAGVRAVDVRLASGRVEIGEDDRADARVDLTVRRRVGRVIPRLVVADGTLRLTGEASEARLRLRLRRATPARVELRAGEVTLWGSAGDLTLLTETATIAARELTGKRVTARSAAGDINLYFTEPPERLSVSAGSGAVTLVLPDGRYRVLVEVADPGARTQVDLADDPEAAAEVLVRAERGPVLIRAAEKARPI